MITLASPAVARRWSFLSTSRLALKAGRLALLAGVASGLTGKAWGQDGYIFTTILGVAGDNRSVDGPVTTARLGYPTGVAVDQSGTVYIADGQNSGIRRLSNGVVTTQAGSAGSGPLGNSDLGGPRAIAIAPDGSLYVCDSTNTISRIPQSGLATIVAGETYNVVADLGYNLPSAQDGVGSQAVFVNPTGIAFDRAGNAFIVDSSANAIRKMDSAFSVSTYANPKYARGSKDGSRQNATFMAPMGITVAKSDNIYVCDMANFTIRKIDPAGNVTTLAGTAGVSGTDDGQGTAARFAGDASLLTAHPDALFFGFLSFGPTGIAVDDKENVYVSDTFSSTIRKISATGLVTTIGGKARETGSVDGIGTAARFSEPTGIAVDSAGNLYIADTSKGTIRKGTPGFLPKIQTQPQGQSFTPGQAIVLSVTAASNSLTPAYQWSKDGTPISGATGATLNLATTQATDAGSYSVVITNPLGSVTSTAAVLTPLARPAPVITSQPAAQSATAGQPITLSVSVSSDATTTYQWQKDGVAIAGATSATLVLTNPAPGDAGNYAVVVTNSAGSVTSIAAALAIAPFNAGHLVNLSILTSIADGESFTLGTVLGGSGTTGKKPLLIRASGPTLGAAPFSIGGVLADPILDLFNGQTTAASNDNWGGGPALVAANAAVGAFPFASAASKDAALTYTIDTSLPQSGYTVKVHGASGTSGLVLAEIYDSTVKDSFATTTPRLINLSVLKPLGGGFTIGFVVDGTTAEKVLVRAVGPQLGKAPFNIGGVVVDPKLELFDGNSKSIGGNDDWGSGGTADLAATFGQVGAFALDTGSKDAALVAKLNPGSYTVQVSPASGATGLVLVEVYEVPGP